MEFTLFYKGELKPNGPPLHKQELRRAFHPQLKNLWLLEPLFSHISFVQPPKNETGNEICLLEKVGDFTFAPLISNRLALKAEIKVTLLRPEEPGKILLQSGDIDNRLKTLFDALSIPAQPNQIPCGDKPKDDEKPFYCLLQDDELITSVSVNTDRLLIGTYSEKEVVMLIHVKTKVTKDMWASIPFL